MTTNKTAFIAQLSKSVQDAIKTDLRLALIDTDLTAEEQETALQDAMDSRLCDLSDTIDISNYI
ncbi:hypothetical protein [Cohnella abietis]|uniref:Uncharacterized protein n=1 Tax=Cohnella abietis TaxID=2507935 RepID=A0A3T1CY30_9BACL|nr:hypothetical protein [Cohnella abietis]BBI30772.1 hypothetical protein KCTCHS21_01710 [Cohnella abietis]